MCLDVFRCIDIGLGVGIGDRYLHRVRCEV